MSDEKKKISIDFRQNNYMVAKKIAGDFNISIGRLMNYLIDDLLVLNKSTKERLSLALARIIIENNDKYSEQSESGRKAITLENKKIEHLIKILNPKRSINKNTFGHNMNKIKIKNGYAMIPDDWVEIRNMDSEICEHIGILTIQNHEKYNFPYHYFYSEYPVEILNDEELDEIYALIQDVNPSFQKIQSMQINPCYDSQTGEFLNKELWEMAPNIMIYELMEYGDDSTYPLDAMIFREKI